MENKWKLSLETFNAAKWPFIICIVLLLYNKEIKARLGDSDIHVGADGVTINRIKNSVDEFKENTLAQVEAIENKLNEAEVTDPLARTELKMQVEQLKTGIENEAGVVEQVIKTSSDDKIDKAEEAKKYEQEAFQHLVNGDAKSAAENFEKAEKIIPGYHNSYELVKLLKDKNSITKKDYSQIIDNYSWGMPKDIKKDMQKKAE